MVSFNRDGHKASDIEFVVGNVARWLLPRVARIETRESFTESFCQEEPATEGRDGWDL